MNPIILNKTEINVTLTPPVDTAIYASGDVLFIPVAVNVLDFVAVNKKLRFNIKNIRAIDVGGQNVAFDLHVFNAAATPGSYGALNAACALNAADAAAGLAAVIPIAAGTVVVAPVSMSTVAPVGLPVITLPAGQKFIYLAGTTRGTPTYPAATNLKLILGLEIINDVHA